MKESYKSLVKAHEFSKNMTQIEPIIGFDWKNLNLKSLKDKMAVNSYFILDLDEVDQRLVYTRATVCAVKDQIILYNDAIVAVYTKTTERTFVFTNPDEELWVDIYKAIGYENLELSQFKYCDFMLDRFWLEIFGKLPSDMWCAGIVAAHGDKAYGYESIWKENGIPFNRGVLLFLLTYTKLSGDVLSPNDWVIDTYEDYLPAIEKVEKEVFFLNEE